MSVRRQKIWITRAQPGAETTAERVRALGHQAFIAPLLTVRPIAGASIDLAGVAALAFTSANGVRAFAEISGERAAQVFAVGAATAQAARAAGFRRVLSADGDVSMLADRIAARRTELKGVVLHPGAAEPAGDLVGALTAQGVEARLAPLYETTPAELSPEQEAALPDLDAVLLHSPKAARILATRLRSAPLPQLRALCLSAQVARPLARARLAARLVAPFPLEAALLNLIDQGP